jgi:hypothetical protein
MKIKVLITVSAVVLMLTGVTLGQQAGEQKKGSSMMESMPDMMKGKQAGEGGMHGMGDMGGMGGMMGMMKMMEQCNDMMKSMHHQADKAKETQTK